MLFWRPFHRKQEVKQQNESHTGFSELMWEVNMVMVLQSWGNAICLEHFLCLIFIYYMNSLKMSVVGVYREKVSGLLPGGGCFGAVMWFWSISSWADPAWAALHGETESQIQHFFSSFPPISVASAQWQCIAKPQTLMKHRCSHLMSWHRQEKLFSALGLV